MAILTDIPITYVNKTGRNDFIVAVFTKNEHINAFDTPFVAWQTLKAQSSATFYYPVSTSVGAHWTIGDVKFHAGPFNAPLGSTWVFKQDYIKDIPILEQVAIDCIDGPYYGPCMAHLHSSIVDANLLNAWKEQDFTAPKNPCDEIVVKNMKPNTWCGLSYNFGIYKSGKLLVTQHDVGVGSQSVFQITPKLYFGVIKDIYEGEIFKSLTSTQKFFTVDLSDFSNGLQVTLDINQASQEFTFSADQV